MATVSTKTPALSTAPTLVPIYGGDGWRRRNAAQLFMSDESFRYHLLQGNNRDEIVRAGLMFMSARRWWTSDPNGLLSLVIAQVQEVTRRRTLASATAATTAAE